MNTNRLLIWIVLLCASHIVAAKQNVGQTGKHPNTSQKTEVADCNASTAQIELAINNVRTRLLTGGDLWWDPIASEAKYEVPKVPINSGLPSLHSLYAGALWIGGIDGATGALKVAAQTYRQTGNDFFPGPLDSNGQTTAETCNDYDRFWTVYGTEIADFVSRYENGLVSSPSQVPTNIMSWPGKNNPYFGDYNTFDLPPNKNLAPFWDRTGDGVYDPLDGDYPVILDCKPSYADQMIWWVFNDRGNSHTETGGEAIGLEVGALAFGFQTNDEVNNMTFYRYTVDNLSTTPLDSTYFGQWVDPDLGQYTDDFVGCVPGEGLGVVYNGDAVDEGFYGENPPYLGVDFFQGPKKRVGTNPDGTPEYEELGMSAFVYYNNNFSDSGNPENASHFYGYLAGVWKDGTPFTFGGTGKGGTTPYPYMFPSDPTLANGAIDPNTSLEAWSECANGNTPDDRRFLQSSGPFILEPGAVNDVIVGVVWMRGAVHPCPSFDLLLRADKKAQALFDNCFDLIDGPDAPELAIRELDQELVISLWNDPNKSNNANEGYREADPVLRAAGIADSLYFFEGYKLYQLAEATVSSSEYSDPDRARLIATVDINNGVGKLINYTYDANLGGEIPSLEVEGPDKGVVHTFNITEDLFAVGDKRLVNNKAYYYSAIAYAYNKYTPYDPINPSAGGQKTAYLAGRNNIKAYKAVTHRPTPQFDGIVLGAEYGDSPDVTQLDGFGCGGLKLELTDESISEILQNGFASDPVYKGGFTPIFLKIFDPVKVKPHQYELRMVNTADTIFIEQYINNNLVYQPAGFFPIDKTLTTQAHWMLTDQTTGEVFYSADSIRKFDEEAVGGWTIGSHGFAIGVQQKNFPSNTSNATISSSLNFVDVQKQWLAPITDVDGASIFNWIRSGQFDNAAYSDHRFSIDSYYDPEQYYESLVEGKLAPYCLVNKEALSDQTPLLAPACSDCFPNGIPYTLAEMQSVDIVFTPDKSKWTKCVVVEMAKSTAISEGKANKNGLRHHASWNKDDNSYASPVSNNLQAGKTYYVGGTSASSVTYTNANGSSVTAAAFTFFTADSNSSFTTTNAAELYDAEDVGYSWFPGYAINVETGERLNVMFSENSFYGTDNGKDMIWNPSDRVLTTTFGPSGNNLRYGGEHYVYVMNSRYDGGQAIHNSFVASELTTVEADYLANKEAVYRNCMYVSATMLSGGFALKSVADGIVPSVATMKVRMTNPYRQLDTIQRQYRYQFDMSKYAAKVQQTDVAKNALEMVQIVPNPYYAFSKYENSQLDNRVRITNLPSRATISIFTLEGTLIEQIKVDNTGLDTSEGGETSSKKINSVDWDLTNFKNIPISSGVYLIHVEAPDLGVERTLKWFCISRPIDLDVF